VALTSSDEVQPIAVVVPASSDEARPVASVAPATNNRVRPMENQSEETTRFPLPAEALTGEERSRYFRQRRQRDPLGEGHPRTWRLLFIKVAAEVVVSSRR